jgi:hypothetical protein
MIYHRRPLSAARPIAAGFVFIGWKCPPIHLRSRKNVVTIGSVADTWNHGPSFCQRDLRPKLVVIAVKLINALRDYFVFKVLPRAVSDPIAGVNGPCATHCLSAKVGTPRLSTRTRRLRQRLAMTICSL